MICFGCPPVPAIHDVRLILASRMDAEVTLYSGILMDLWLEAVNDRELLRDSWHELARGAVRNRKLRTLQT